MAKFLKVSFQILFFFFPWALRRILLNKLFSYEIDKNAHIGFSIILTDKLKMDSNSKISHFNLCNGISLLSLDEKSSIGTFNYITGFPNIKSLHFNHLRNRKCHLVLGEHSAITSRHFIDCTTGVFIGKFTIIAGIRSQIFTHSINLQKNIQDGESVFIGDYCFVGTRVIILPGSSLPNHSILGAASLLNKKYFNSLGLYSGIPAVLLRDLDINEYKYFTRSQGFVY